MKDSKAITACRYWLRGNLYPNTDQDSFLSLLMGMYKLTAPQARNALSDAEWMERHQDRKEIQND